jgi:hypothetical protein
MYSIPDDSPELVSSAIRESILDHDSDVCSIVPEVGHLGSSADIDMIADHRVSEIGEMGQSRGLANI